MGVNHVEVHVDELVLTGFGRVDADLVARAFRRELARLLTEEGAPSRELSAAVVDDLPALTAGGSARRLGTALARSVHSGLTGDAR